MEHNDIIWYSDILRDIHIRVVVVVIFDALTFFLLEKENRLLGEGLEKFVLHLFKRVKTPARLCP